MPFRVISPVKALLNFRRFVSHLLLCATLLAPSAGVRGEPLVIDFMVSSGQQRTAWVRILNRFSAENPDIEVVNNEFSQERYKSEFLDRHARAQVDIAFWFAGERMRDAAARKLIVPLDASLLASLNKIKSVAATIESASIDGRAYGFPISSYPWGFFYRKSVFARLGLGVPVNWNEFLAVCARLKTAGVTPLAVGAKNGWPAAGWFDYLDLRLNGREFHRRLLRGEEKFTDPRVRKVFDEWRRLLVDGDFLPASMGEDWEFALPFLYREKVGMILMGSFAGARFPASVAADMGFFAFPRMADGVPPTEEAPLDVLVLPARGQHLAARTRFLAFLGGGSALRELNDAQNTLSPRFAGTERESPIQEESRAVLDAAAGYTFFFDRDARAGLVAPAFDAFRRFLRPPFDAQSAILLIDQQAR